MVAKAKPARALKSTTPAVTVLATITEFVSALKKSTFTSPELKRRETFSRRLPPGVTTGG